MVRFAPLTREEPGHPVLAGVATGVLAVVAVASFSLLAVLSFLGLYVRPSADDFCVLYKTRDLGVLGITRDYYLTQNGRLANAFVSGLVSIDGTHGMRVLPGFLAVSFGLGLVLLLRRIWSMLGWRAPFPAFVAVAGVIELVLLTAAYRPYQVLLWAPGSISHTLPTVVAVWAVFLGLKAGEYRRWWVRGVAVAGALLTGFFLGTLTEPALVVFGLLAGTAAMVCVPLPRSGRGWYPVLWCVAACTGLVAGYAVLYASPGAELRRGHDKPPMLSGPSLRGAAEDWLRVMHILTSEWTYLGVFVAGLLAGVLTVPAALARRLPRVRIGVALVLVAPLLLAGSYVVILGLRHGYGVNGWRNGRIWFTFVAPMALTVCAYGVLLGRSVRLVSARLSVTAGAATAAATSVLAGAVLLLCAHSLLPVVQAQAELTITRARVFDAQDARIRAEVARGATVPVYRPNPVPGLAEPNARPRVRTFADTCAAKYYRVQRLIPPPKPVTTAKPGK